MINMIAAIDMNRAIGNDNKLLFHLPNDMKYFKALTTGKTVVMGHTTYNSIGKPLPNRTNVVLTRNKEAEFPSDVIVKHSMTDLITGDYDDLWVIGGSMIYRQFLPFADRIYLTIVETVAEDTDRYFPELPSEWACISKEKQHKDENNQFDHWFCIYEKIGN